MYSTSKKSCIQDFYKVDEQVYCISLLLLFDYYCMYAYCQCYNRPYWFHFASDVCSDVLCKDF